MEFLIDGKKIEKNIQSKFFRMAKLYPQLVGCLMGKDARLLKLLMGQVCSWFMITLEIGKPVLLQTKKSLLKDMKTVISGKRVTIKKIKKMEFGFTTDSMEPSILEYSIVMVFA